MSTTFTPALLEEVQQVDGRCGHAARAQRQLRRRQPRQHRRHRHRHCQTHPEPGEDYKKLLLIRWL